MILLLHEVGIHGLIARVPSNNYLQGHSLTCTPSTHVRTPEKMLN